MLGDRGVIFCHRGVVGDIDARVLRVQPVELWEPVFMPRSGADIVAFAVPASDGFGLVQTSWVMNCGGKRLIHCGDTLWHGEFWDIGRALGPFDIAFLPINGARQNTGRFRDLGAPGVMTPQLAVAAARALDARLIVPIHYGLSSASVEYIETPNAEDALRTEARRHDIGVRVLERGEEMTV
jgi:L-ascorbate metabolism protein UlaG (beta-lactamase superfamily)